MFAIPPAMPVCHPDRLIERSVNLDGDRAKERVTAVDHHDCAHTEWLAYVRVRDRCGTYELGSRNDVLQAFRIANADGRTRRPEVFFATSKVAPFASGVAKLVRFDDDRSGCSRPRVLFRYVPGPGIKSFGAELKDVAPRFPGLEIVLTEGREVAQQVMHYRYDRTFDRYVRYAGRTNRPAAAFSPIARSAPFRRTVICPAAGCVSLTSSSRPGTSPWS